MNSRVLVPAVLLVLGLATVLAQTAAPPGEGRSGDQPCGEIMAFTIVSPCRENIPASHVTKCYSEKS